MTPMRWKEGVERSLRIAGQRRDLSSICDPSSSRRDARKRPRKSETDEDGKLPVQQNSASTPSHGCAQKGKPKTRTGKNKIKTPLTRPASLEMAQYPFVFRINGKQLSAELFRSKVCQKRASDAAFAVCRADNRDRAGRKHAFKCRPLQFLVGSL